MVGHCTHLPEDWPRTWNLTWTPSLAAGSLGCCSRACTISALPFSSKGSQPTLIILGTFEVFCKLPQATSCGHVNFQMLLPDISITHALVLSKFDLYSPFKLIWSTNLPHLGSFPDALFYAHLLFCMLLCPELVTMTMGLLIDHTSSNHCQPVMTTRELAHTLRQPMISLPYQVFQSLLFHSYPTLFSLSETFHLQYLSWPFRYRTLLGLDNDGFQLDTWWGLLTKQQITFYNRYAVKATHNPSSLPEGKTGGNMRYAGLYFWLQFPEGKELFLFCLYEPCFGVHSHIGSRRVEYVATLRSKRDVTVPEWPLPQTWAWTWVLVWILGICLFHTKDHQLNR